MENKNHEIEILRAMAIILAITAHVNGILFPPGQRWMMEIEKYLFLGVGVDIFFCISGFVVSRSLISGLDRHFAIGTHWNYVRSFWVRRLFRLMPSSLFWAIFGLLCATHFSTANFDTVDANLRSVFTVLTFSGNIQQPFNQALGPNIVYWSLALEEQFYCFFSILLLWTGSNKVRLKLFFWGVAILFFFPREGGGLLWFTRVDGFLWGIIIVTAPPTPPFRAWPN